ncbi:hypothetical protein L1085_009585 [Streptomyces sp. MSC1_001]|jgi:hypothetical protein|uniref:hypothetical protein n=1 Tax=Streptomyces sp. MSC1_001 TaxID=2909263 RepID=UPI00202F76AC|nr:hypothetical protein [Streptomyces sp. MSC1_001]
MAHRTHPTQQDEALRQTRLDDTIRQGLRAIADKLAHRKPDHLMTTSQRLAVALTISDDIHPTDAVAAEELERQLLRRMPFVDGNVVTRGEYALWLRKTSWSA